MASEVFSTLPGQDKHTVVTRWLSSSVSHYRLESVLGQGSFGLVARCTRMLDSKTVAIKMIKNQGGFTAAAYAEVATLMELQRLDPDKCNFVRWYQAFNDNGCTCLEFEHLDKSLYDFMKERYFQPLLLKEIRPIVQQLATALHHLKGIGMIHADLKLENVMLVNHVREPYRVKLIDFGLACKTSTACLGSYIQTRPYRSPEIILGLPFTEAIDMWSLGCMTVTLYLGTLLYPGYSEYDVMRGIVETQGQPPDELLNFGFKTGRFFQKDNSSTTSLWKLKTAEQFKAETGIQPMETRRTLKSLYDLLDVQNREQRVDKSAELNDLVVFVDLVVRMLHLNAAKRVTPRQVLEHPFISMCNMNHNSSYVRSCFEIMDHCQKKPLASDCGKAVCGSVQQPSSGRSHPVHQYLPPSAERSSRSQPHRVNPRTCSGTQATSTVKAGMKRKVDDKDRTSSKTPHLSKKVKSSWHSSQASTSAQTKSRAQSGLKRRAPDDDVPHGNRTADLRASKKRKTAVVCSEEDRSRKREHYIAERRTNEPRQYRRTNKDYHVSSSARLW